MLNTEERQKARASVEMGVLQSLKACGDDAEAICAIIETNDLAVSVIIDMLEASGSVMAELRRLRGIAEANVRCDAIEAATRLEAHG